MNIVFIGFASCGKSATGLELAEKLDMDFVDTDKEIEVNFFKEHGKKLCYRDIIVKEGRGVFLAIEKKVIQNLEGKSGYVVAPGGGAVLDGENRKILKSFGPVIYLETDPAVIFERMKVKGIPLFLRDNPVLENLRNMCQQRHSIYKDMADFTIDNTELSISETVEKVMKILKTQNLIQE